MLKKIGFLIMSTFAAYGAYKALHWVFRPKNSSLAEDDPLVDVLHYALANRTGKLRIADAYLICGIEPNKANQDQITRLSRAIRELGWERQRHRLDGVLQYVYVKGTPTEREVNLMVEYDPHSRMVSIGKKAC